jgi:hydrogenase maturation protease
LTATAGPTRVLVMGIGNTLLQDDGVGVHVAEQFRASLPPDSPITVLDGGTIGLSLLPELEDADAVVIVDASEMDEQPGTVRQFLDGEIDRQLSGKRRTVHEVALADLFAAAEIRGRSPAVRALVAIQPACTEWGLEPTEAVRAAIPRACAEIQTLTLGWLAGEAAA